MELITVREIFRNREKYLNKEIQVESRTEESIASFDEAKESIRRNLLNRKQNTVYNEKVKALREKYNVK